MGRKAQNDDFDPKNQSGEVSQYKLPLLSLLPRSMIHNLEAVYTLSDTFPMDEIFKEEEKECYRQCPGVCQSAHSKWGGVYMIREEIWIDVQFREQNREQTKKGNHETTEGSIKNEIS